MFRIRCRGKMFYRFRIKSIISRLKMSSKADVFPDTLEKFGYGFNSDGQLRQLNADTGEVTNSPFEFAVSTNPSYNQKHYEALGEVITKKVYELLDSEGLQRLPVPKGDNDGSFVFSTSDINDADKLLVLIHGSGVVRAGQWARSLIINDCLDSGTQLPYIRKAIQLGYGVYVLNTNDNNRIIDGKTVPLVGSKTPQEHANTFWENYVLNSRAQKIAIVAHSFGGIVTMSLASQFEEDFLNRVFAIGLTDSVHGRIPRAVSSVLADHLAKVGKNWVSCLDPLDTPLPEQHGEIPCVSAGVAKHELTSSYAISSLFKFIEERRNQRFLTPHDGL